MCRWNTPLHLHPNDPSSGPRGRALCTTQRSIRATAQRLLCPIINPNSLSHSLSLSRPPLSHMSHSSAPPSSHASCSPTYLPQALTCTHTHTHTFCSYQIQNHAFQTIHTCTHTDAQLLSLSPRASVVQRRGEDSISTLLLGKATQRPGCEMYILPTELAVHNAPAAANHEDIKAKRFAGG